MKKGLWKKAKQDYETESKGTQWDKQNKKQTPSHTDAKGQLTSKCTRQAKHTLN